MKLENSEWVSLGDYNRAAFEDGRLVLSYDGDYGRIVLKRSEWWELVYFVENHWGFPNPGKPE